MKAHVTRGTELEWTPLTEDEIKTDGLFVKVLPSDEAQQRPPTFMVKFIADALRSEGIEVANFKPQRLSSEEASGASRIVAIGVDLSAFSGVAHAPIEQWGDVPPASVDYAASRAALLRHIHVLVDELAGKR